MSWCLQALGSTPQVAHPPPISTPSGAGQLQQNGDGASPGVVSTPGTAPSPTVDSVLHSIWVDIIDREDLRFGRRLGECASDAAAPGSTQPTVVQPLQALLQCRSFLGI
jgi:hypothetical protein